MKKSLTTLLLLMIAIVAFTQAPFTTLVKEPRAVIEKETADGQRVFLSVDSTETRKALESPSAATAKLTEKSDVDFFSSSSLSLNLINKGNNRVSINSQVLHYKLYIANPNEDNYYRWNRYNIPLLLITKLSNTYDTLNASTALDVLDYEAAPLTIRMMPSFKVSFDTYNDVIYLGFYTDLRGLNLYNEATSGYDLELVGSGGFGLTYQGDGAAGTYNEKGEYTPGKFSISVILQGAVGNRKVIESLFDTSNKYVTSLQSYFLFKVSEKSHLNVKAGYQYLFQETIGGTKSVFTLSLGI